MNSCWRVTYVERARTMASKTRPPTREKNAENTDEGIGALTEYLRHRFWAARPRGERQIRGRFCARVTSRGLYHSCEKRIKEAKGLGFLPKLPPDRPAGGVECRSTRFLR